MENIICNAYAYIEYNKKFKHYRKADTEGRSENQLVKDWAAVIVDYEKVSEYMSDSAIKQAQAFVMGEF